MLRARSMHTLCALAAWSIHAPCKLSARLVLAQCTLCARSVHTTPHSMHAQCTLHAHSMHGAFTLHARSVFSVHTLFILCSRYVRTACNVPYPLVHATHARSLHALCMLSALLGFHGWAYTWPYLNKTWSSPNVNSQTHIHKFTDSESHRFIITDSQCIAFTKTQIHITFTFTFTFTEHVRSVH